MLTHDDEITDRVLDALTKVLGRERSDLLEDFGTFVVSDSTLQPVRKLLRFGGGNYVGFLHSLEDVHDRAKIALPDLDGCTGSRSIQYTPFCENINYA